MSDAAENLSYRSNDITAPPTSSAGKKRAVKGKALPSQRYSCYKIGVSGHLRIFARHFDRVRTTVGIMTSLNSFSILRAFGTGCLAIALAACAGADVEYPSLAVRDAERMVGQFTPVTPSEPVPPPVTPLTTREAIGSVIEEARDLHRRFLAAQPAAMTLARQARGDGNESDRRSRALIALADQSTLQSAMASQLAVLDRLEFEAASAFGATGDIREAQALVVDLMAQQDAALDSLSREMRR